MKGKPSQFTREEKLQIIEDYETGNLSMREINEKYGIGSCATYVKDSYFNMKEIIDNHMYTIDRAVEAMEQVGVKPIIVPIRGGTDGARLSFMGLPCPNICTGGENFHSRFEYLSVQSLNKVVEIVERIIINATYAERK